jgi:hypothetical protein
LLTLSRLWVHNIIQNKEFMIPDWLTPVAQTTERLEDSIFSFDGWKARFCLEQHCSLEQVIALSWRFKEELTEEEEKLAQKSF